MVSAREKGKVYFDYLQNASGKTISAPYVLRAHPGAPVATPLKWEEVVPGLKPQQFHIANVLRTANPDLQPAASEADENRSAEHVFIGEPAGDPDIDVDKPFFNLAFEPASGTLFDPGRGTGFSP